MAKPEHRGRFFLSFYFAITMWIFSPSLFLALGIFFAMYGAGWLTDWLLLVLLSTIWVQLLWATGARFTRTNDGGGGGWLHIHPSILQNLLDKHIELPRINGFVNIGIGFGQTFVLDHFVEKQMLSALQPNGSIMYEGKKERINFVVITSGLESDSCVK